MLLTPYGKRCVRYHSLYFPSQAATNRLCGLYSVLSGTCPIFLFARHGAKFGSFQHLIDIIIYLRYNTATPAVLFRYEHSLGKVPILILASEQRDDFRHPAVMILLYYCTSAFILSLYSGAQYSWSMYSSVLSFDTASALSKDFLQYFTDSPWSRLSAKRT